MEIIIINHQFSTSSKNHKKWVEKIQYIPPLKQQFYTSLSPTPLFHIILSTTFINCGKLYNSFTNNDLISTNQWDKWK